MKKETWVKFQAIVRTDYQLYGPNYATGFDAGKDAFSSLVGHLPDEIILPALQEARESRAQEGRSFPVEPGDVLRAALALLSPIPPPELAWDNACVRAMMSKPPPPLHRLVDDTANNLGGMEALCSVLRQGEVSAVDRLRGSYLVAYKSLSGLWYADVRKQMYLPEPERNPQLFCLPAATRLALPWDQALQPAQPRIEQKIPTREELGPMPPDLFDKIRGIGKGGVKQNGE